MDFFLFQQKPMSGERLGRNARNRLYQHYKNREQKFRDDIEGDASGNENDDGHVVDGSWVGPLQIDCDDVEYIFSEVWRNRCCVTGDSLGTILELSRWDPSKPSNCQNIVLLGVKAMKRFDEEIAKTGDGRNFISSDLRAKIEARLSTCKIDSRA